MEKEDNSVITVLFFIIAIVFIFVITHFSHPSIEKQAEKLRENGYKLNYEAIEEFATAWNEYIESEAEQYDLEYEPRY